MRRPRGVIFSPAGASRLGWESAESGSRGAGTSAALAREFAGRGRDVTVGTHDPSKRDGWLAGVEGTVAAGAFADAAGHGDVAVPAARGTPVSAVLDLAGPDRFAGSLVLDATSPLALDEAGVSLAFGGTESLGERVQATLDGARVLNCFDTVSNAQMPDPDFASGTPPTFVCGDDGDAKGRDEEILVASGWPGPLDVGDIAGARYLEALVPFRVRVGGVLDTTDHAFAVVE